MSTLEPDSSRGLELTPDVVAKASEIATPENLHEFSTIILAHTQAINENTQILFSLVKILSNQEDIHNSLKEAFKKATFNTSYSRKTFLTSQYYGLAQLGIIRKPSLILEPEKPEGIQWSPGEGAQTESVKRDLDFDYSLELQALDIFSEKFKKYGDISNSLIESGFLLNNDNLKNISNVLNICELLHSNFGNVGIDTQFHLTVYLEPELPTIALEVLPNKLDDPFPIIGDIIDKYEEEISLFKPSLSILVNYKRLDSLVTCKG